MQPADLVGQYTDFPLAAPTHARSRWSSGSVQPRSSRLITVTSPLSAFATATASRSCPEDRPAALELEPDALAQLDYLRAASGGLVSHGQETVNGTSTTHYSGTLQFSRLASAVPPAQRAAVQQLVAQLRKKNESVGAIPFDVWIDGSHLIRRMSLTEHLSTGGQSATVHIRIDYLAYGPQPEPTPPPASAVTDLSSLAGAG